jgi:hypothetical protein
MSSIGDRSSWQRSTAKKDSSQRCGAAADAPRMGKILAETCAHGRVARRDGEDADKRDVLEVMVTARSSEGRRLAGRAWRDQVADELDGLGRAAEDGRGNQSAGLEKNVARMLAEAEETTRWLKLKTSSPSMAYLTRRDRSLAEVDAEIVVGRNRVLASTATYIHRGSEASGSERRILAVARGQTR